MTTVQIELPDQLAQEAQRAGLLSSARLEPWLREQIKGQRVDELFMAMERMAALDEPAVMSPEEVAQEMAALRAQRRKADAPRTGPSCLVRPLPWSAGGWQGRSRRRWCGSASSRLESPA
jgi:hypothetical protein